MTKVFYLTKHDRQPYYSVQVKDSAGSVVNLTSATIYCTMKTVKGNTVKINRATSGINLSDPTNGKFEYRWGTADVDTSGEYNIEFEVTPSGGMKFTVPTPREGPAKVVIREDLDDT